jgi:hypothetical protein
VISDYDGYAAGHGGIHAYYEDSAVAYFGADMNDRIVKAAKKMSNRNFLNGKDTIEKMWLLAEQPMSGLLASKCPTNQKLPTKHAAL